MFVEFVTNKGEYITFNTQNIVMISPYKKGTLVVDVNGIDWILSEDYNTVKALLHTVNVGATITMD